MADLIKVTQPKCADCKVRATVVLLDDYQKVVGRYCKKHGEAAYALLQGLSDLGGSPTRRQRQVARVTLTQVVPPEEVNHIVAKAIRDNPPPDWLMKA